MRIGPHLNIVRITTLVLALRCVALHGQPLLPEKQQLDQFLDSQIANGAVPSVAVFIVDKSKGIVYQHASGKGNKGSELRTDDLFAIYSMTKPVTAVAVLQLVEQGKLGLDDPVSRYIPEFADLPVIKSFDWKDTTYTTEPQSHPITIRQLLSHTSGLAYDFVSNELEAISAKMEKTGTKKGKKVYLTFPLLFQPGTRWHYGTGTEALGDIIAKVSGESLDVYFKRHIFDPLGMKDTFFEVPEEKKSRLADRYQKNGNGYTARRSSGYDKPVILGGYGLFSTGQDYSRFIQCLLNDGSLDGKRLLASASVKEMSRNQIGGLNANPLKSANPGLTKSFPEAGNLKFGLGSIIAGTTLEGRRSMGSYGWAGILNTFFWIDPARQTGTIVMMQQLPFFDDPCLETLHGVESILYAN